MCGINGFNWSDDEVIEKMNVAIKHRGPDDEGTYVTDNLSLGHVRLSILDLSEAGHQPMFYDKKKGACSEKYQPKNMEDSHLTIVFNGEIYNFKEIKSELRKKDYRFSTKTDTEVIMAAYDAWGEDCVKKFVGMWTFAIHDRQKNILFCSRDRFGKKPFFYYKKDDKFVFSSEIKGILEHSFIPRKPNEKLISDYLYFDLMKHTDQTFFKDIFLLEPSSNLIFDLEDNELTVKKYYELQIKDDPNNMEQAIDELDRLLEESVKHRLVSDVPVAISLSGGIDSSTISGYLNKLGRSKNMNAFTVAFEAENTKDETDKVKQILKKYPEFQLNEARLDSESFFDCLEDIVYHQEEPIGGSSLYVRYMIANTVKNKDMKVLMTGEGADEVFGGYSGVYPVHLASQLKKLKFISFLKKLMTYRKFTSPKKLLLETIFLILPEKLKTLYLKMKSKELQKQGVRIPPNPEEKAKTFSFGSLNEYLYERIFKSSMTLLLDFNDKMGMANSIESRSPLVDFKLLELGFSTDEDKKIKDGFRKYLLRKVGEKFVPSEIIWEKNKQAFPSPTGEFIRDKQFGELLHELFEDPLSDKIIDGAKIIEHYENNKQGKNLNSKFILKCLFLEIWYLQFKIKQTA